jgi:hypothetical protein
MSDARALRATLGGRIRAALGSPEGMQSLLGDVALPLDIERWLARLALLEGVPFNYLVPHEAMLPPESIRFFHLDLQWVDAMIDGAFSVGRNLTAGPTPATLGIDHALLKAARARSLREVAAVRARRLGKPPAPVSLQAVSGFLLRSSLVADYPGLGVNAYPKGGTPEDRADAEPLALLRFDRLGAHSDTLICLVDGEAARFDIHEPPEHLHYGLERYRYDPATGKVSAAKKLWKFDREGSQVRLGDEIEQTVDDCFRASSPRVVKTGALADLVAAAIGRTIDPAELGFEMTQGVGTASFEKRSAPA